MTIASLMIDVGANTATLVKNVEQVQGTLQKVGTAVAAAFSFREVAAAAERVVDMAGRLDDLSHKAGITAEAVQELDFAAKQNGLTFETVSNALAQMGNRLVEGDKGTVGAMERLGLNIEAIRQMAPDKAFEEIARAIGGIEDPMERSKLAMDVFGKAGAQLLPLLTADIGKLRDTARDSGLVISNELVASGDQLGDQWDTMQTRLQALMAKGMLPLLDLFSKMPESLQMVTGLAVSMAPAFSNIGIAIMAAGGPVAAFGAISTAFTAILPFLGPVGLIAAGVAAVVLVWKNWDAIVEIVMKVYNAVKEWLVDRFTAIVANIKAKIDAVIGFFGDMYEKVVGNSFVPDMVEAIGKEFGRLGDVMVTPSMSASGLVGEVFDRLSQKVQSIVSNMLSKVGGKFGEFLQDVVPGFLGSLGGLLGQGVSAIVGSLIGHFQGGEEGTQVNPARDAFLLQYGPPGTGPGSGFRTLADRLAAIDKHYLFEALARADTMEKFNAATSAIKGIPGFAFGTMGQFRDFGAGTPVVLHGKERVMTEAEGRAEGSMSRELAGLRSDMRRMLDALPNQMQAAVQLARGRGASFQT